MGRLPVRDPHAVRDAAAGRRPQPAVRAAARPGRLQALLDGAGRGRQAHPGGEGWLAAHPDRGAITRRYLANRRGLVRSALGRLADAEDAPDEALDPAEVEEEAPATEEGQERAPSEEKSVPLAEQRLESVVQALREEDARRVIDLGCGSGKLLARLAKDDFFSEVSGTDVSHRALSHAWRRLRWDQEPRRESGRVHDVFRAP